MAVHDGAFLLLDCDQYVLYTRYGKMQTVHNGIDSNR